MTLARTANLLGALSGALSERAAVPFGDHPNQTDTASSALKLIAEADGCSNAELALALGLSHPATVRLLDRLEAAALVERRQAGDRRAVALHLTPAGRRRGRHAVRTRGQALQAAIQTLSPAQLEQLEDIATSLLSTLTTSPLEGAHICRLCDRASCPHASCPVHLRAHALAAG